jgi:hypothetical protein
MLPTIMGKLHAMIRRGKEVFFFSTLEQQQLSSSVCG